ncbi:sensor histidine kinase [Streptococcus hillyeri]|uniref:ATP-binding response regulator n=1 Tax=Streptococcus hillyeri TaxID=2282420 RepID=UPI0034E24CCD
MKNKSKKRASLVQVLLGQFIIYMIILLVAVFTWIYLSLTVMATFNMGVSKMELSKIEKQLKKENFDSRLFSVLNRYGQFYEIISHDKGIVYSSDPSHNHNFSNEELEIMLPYDADYYYTSTPYSTDDGSMRYFVQRNRESMDKYVASDVIVEEEEFVYLLDNNLNILVSKESNQKKRFTSRELRILTQTLFDEYHLYKHDFKTDSGEEMSVVMFRPYDTSLEVQTFYDRIIFNLGFLLLLVVIVIIVFTWRLNKRISVPLKVLDDAIKKLSQKDRVETVSDYSGPRELMEIFETFNAVSLELYNSEAKRRELEESKQTMIANISHDLRTPITVIQGYSKALTDKLVVEETRERYTQIIHQKSILLGELISSLFEFSQAQHPNFELQAERIDFCEYLRNYWAKRYDEFMLQDYRLNIEIPETSYFVQLDDSRFTRALDNLLNNFIKYNPSQTTLSFKVRSEEHTLILAIADDGTKISTDIAATIFQPFVTGNSARTSGEGGTGLGLAIVKQIVTLHGGNICLRTENVAPYSKVFELTLPIVTELENM